MPRQRKTSVPPKDAQSYRYPALRVEFEDIVWEHLAGTTSAPFLAGEHSQIAVKVIDPRGNELLVVKKLEETR
jgi:adenine-specific DNA-methyltransferase